MQRTKDLISFGPGTGLNWDDDLQVMPKGDGKYRLNISLDENEKGGVLSKAKGNSLLRNIIDPQGSINTWTGSAQITPSRLRYAFSLSNNFLYNVSYNTAGIVFNILTDNGNYKIIHKVEDFASTTTASANIKGKIDGLMDDLIYETGYTVYPTYVSFYIDILDTSILRGVRSLNFLYDTLGSIYFYFGGDTYKKNIVGSYYHAKDNELYTFWAADLNENPSPYSDNVIVRYKYNEGLSEVLNSSKLTIPSTIAKWSKYTPITAVVIGDDDSKLLYWTDGVNPPMNINVEKAVNTLYGYYGDVYSNHNTDILRNLSLNLIKSQPTYGPFTDSSTVLDTTINSDITSHPVQFIHRYIFYDNELSTWSVVSNVTFHSYERADGSFETDSDTTSYRCFIEPPDTTGITKIQFAFRTNMSDHWKICKTVDYDGSTAIIYTLTGLELTEVMDDQTANLLYDNVPITSGIIGSINDNRLLLADNIVGQPNTTMDVTATAVAAELSLSDSDSMLWRSANTVNTTTKDLYVYSSGATLGGSGMVYIVFKTTLNEYIIHCNSVGLSAAEIADYFVSYINSEIVGADQYISAAANSSNNVRITHSAGAWLYGISTVYGHYQKMMKLKNGMGYNLGIVYSDQFGRRGYVNEIDKINIPFYTQQTAFTNNEYFDVIQLEINHTPPVWAHSWGIYYSDNAPAYRQVAVKVADFTREDGNLGIKLDSVLNEGVEFNPKFKLSYQFTDGDRLRWIGTIGDVASGSQYRKVVTLLTDYIDVAILGYGGDFNEYLMIPDYAGYIDATSNINAASYVLVEIFTPNKFEATSFYYETQYKFPVLNPGTSTAYHGVVYEPVTGQGNLQEDEYGITVRDQTDTLSAICYFDKMDYRILQHWKFESGQPITCYIDSQSFSNYMDSRLRNYGKPHMANPEARQIRLNTIQWSNTFIPNSRVNGLSTFSFTDEKSMDDKHGRITGLEVTGDILNVIQQSKTSSIYLGAVLSKDANGNEILSYSNVVIGESRASLEDWGSIHKNSIVRYGNYVYGFDIQSAVSWRKSQAGMEDISAYGMKSYFKIKALALKESGLENIIVVAGFDAYKKIYFLTFIDLYNSVNSETIGFHEPSNKWISFYSFIPDMYASIENVQFLTFKNGYMYEQWAGTNCNYYGTQYGSEVWAVYNQYPTQPKVFESIQENSNAIWEMPDAHSIIVDDDAIEYTDVRDYTHHTASMQSRLKTNRFRYKNGEFHAGFLRDMGTSATQYNLMNGRKLRGKTLVCKLENSSTSNVYLRSVTIGALI